MMFLKHDQIANSVDPEQIAPLEQFDLGLHICSDWPV